MLIHMELKILILPGDGIGVEVTREAVRVLERVANRFSHKLSYKEGLLGGIAIHKTGSPFPPGNGETGLRRRRHVDGRCRSSRVR